MFPLVITRDREAWWEYPTEQLSDAEGALVSAIEHNGPPPVSATTLTVIACVEGENDGPEWHWIAKADTDEYLYIVGGCDYTGWDCQSHIQYVAQSRSLEELMRHVPSQDDNNRRVADLLSEQLARWSGG